MKQKDKNSIFFSVTTSERHRNIGYCEPSDFGSVELIKLSPEKKVPIIEFKKYSGDPLIELIEYNKFVYKKVNKDSYFCGMAKDEEAEWLKLQGKFTDKSATKLILELRKRSENTFSSVSDINFLIIGKTLYQRYCEVKKLKITVCGNLLFSYWLSIDIEPEHGGKGNTTFSRKNFEKLFKTQKERFESGKPTKKRGDGHVSFSYPKNITWGEKYK